MSYDIVGLRGGHSINCQGAVGLRNEYYCMQELYKAVRDILVRYGKTVIDCNSNGYNASSELYEGVSKANAANVDIFISLHMNAATGNAYGTEAWTYSSDSRANEVAQRLVNNFATLGFCNRGVKYNANYYEMQNVNAPNIIFETLFCDSAKDVAIWSPTPYETMARLIANAIDPNIPLTEETVNYTHYALEQVNIVDSNENVTGAVWKDEKFERKYVDGNYRWYIKYWNSDKTKIKEGFIEKGKEGLMLEIGKIPEEPTKPEEPEEPKKLYKVQSEAFSKKENAENLINDLKAKGFNGFIIEV